jgi:hypothetical protein
MPVIRIDDEVYKCLQQRARPFVDTPNDVLRSLLGLGEASLSQARNEPTENDKEVNSTMGNIRKPARDWLRQQLTDPTSSISAFLIKHSVYRKYGFSFFKRYAHGSKYFQAGESYPGIPCWWLQIFLQWVSKPDDPFPFALLLCQKRPGNFSDFWCLAVPLEYLSSEHSKGNLGTLGKYICLHLSAENCTYRGYEVKMFDDVRLTMLTGHRPTPFGQFSL